MLITFLFPIYHLQYPSLWLEPSWSLNLRLTAPQVVVATAFGLKPWASRLKGRWGAPGPTPLGLVSNLLINYTLKKQLLQFRIKHLHLWRLWNKVTLFYDMHCYQKNMQYESLDKELTSIGLRQENSESYRTYFARWRNEVISKWKRCSEGLIQMWLSLVVWPVWRWRSQHQKNKCLVRCNLDWDCGMLKEESTVQIPTLYILGCIVSPFHLQPTVSIELAYTGRNI